MGYRLWVIGMCLLAVVSVFAVSPTGTLPLVYITTQDNRAITDTETQIPMNLYINPLQTGYTALGSSNAPIEGTIKGRGNWTWRGFDKKPYKVKFTVKQKVLGMPNNRHWCLMAFADDYLGFLKTPAGFMLSQALGLRWTPRYVPVELVLNGRYMGLYFLTEQVRIASNRVHIQEQEDNETRPEFITGGWLVEIDNYETANNVVIYEANEEEPIMLSLKEPEEPTTVQRTYIETQLNALNDALYGDSPEELAQRLDLEEAAKYYLIQEILEDCESYHGSCFLYKDRDSLGVSDPWKFGPVWDFGNAYDRYKYAYQEAFIYVNPTFPQHWITQLAQWPEFQQKVQEQWYIFYHTHKEPIRTQIRELVSTISQAAKNDAAIWNGSQNYCSNQGDNSNMTEKQTKFFRRYDWRIDWLYSQWGEGIRPASWDNENIQEKEQPSRGRKVLRNGQFYIECNGLTYSLLGQPID